MASYSTTFYSDVNHNHLNMRDNAFKLSTRINNAMNLSNRINELLEESGRSASELARYCKISRSAVSKWKTDQVTKIDVDTAEKIARFFGVSPLWVRTGNGPKYTHEKNANEKTKLFEIIEAADRAMADSGFDFSDEERLENYFAALDFAGRQHFSNDFVTQYIKELLNSKKKIT